MLPTEQFSGDATEDKSSWQPQVWQDGPDALVAQAQQDLFQHRLDVEVDALGDGTDAPAMAGSVNQGANEEEQSINPASPPEGRRSRHEEWSNTVDLLRAVSPLAGQVKPTEYDPPAAAANPSP